jgi:alpha-1,2-mannosyltransferase
MVSFAQFRPEKDHALQLRVWARVVPKLPDDAVFMIVGSVRDPDDQRIVDELRKLADELGISKRVEFKINLSRDDLHAIFSKAKVAVHTMRNEHFGIAVVELMASGIVTIAHNSAGPREDIIGGTEDEVGFLANTEDDYAFLVA